MQYCFNMATKPNPVPSTSSDPSVPRADPSLEQVRDILFGQQQRSFNNDLSVLEARVLALEKRSEDLERELAATKDELEARIRSESQRQDKALNAESNRLNKLIETEVSQLQAQHQQAMADLETLRLKDRAKLAALMVSLAQQLEAD